ncbi:MAG: hypothetical protein KF830_03660 [Planctomycetes bacterium]|nr:hypothetical protein [Planctomycetota bacterium]
MTSAGRGGRAHRALLAGLALAVAAAVLRLAWISDDAYITLRVVENLLAGHGPVWNVGERVQAFTHPLWMLLLALARGATGEHYLTTLGLSLGCAAFAVGLLAATAGRGAAVVLTLLLASRAFGDFATSGLETPLAMLLVAWLAWLDDRSTVAVPRPGAVLLALALLGATRLDLVVLAAPVALAHLRAAGPRRWPRAALALAPLLLWSAFAAVYYGSPFPITAYAKAFAPGVPAGELWLQGGRYVVHTLAGDPVTMATALGGALLAGVRPALRGRMLALGIGLYVLYVVRMGGDFMAGRFFVPVLVAGAALWARWLRGAATAWRIGIAGAAAALAFVPGPPPWLLPVAADLEPVAGAHGILDERRFYFARAGLCSPQREIPRPGDGSRGLRLAGRTAPLVVKCDAVGRDPFVAGEAFHFVDRWIVDPLLARLPVARPGEWRIGHFTRAIPDGYLESLATGEDRIAHPGLRALYGDLRRVLRAPLADRQRLAALWRLWTGAHAAGLADYVAREYRSPPRREVAAARLPPSPWAEGEFWFDEPRAVVVGDGGLAMTFPGPVEATHLRLALAPLVQYRLRFHRGGEACGEVALLATSTLGPMPAPEELLGYLRRVLGFRHYEVAVPATARGFDRLDLDAVAELAVVPALGGVEPR